MIIELNKMQSLQILDAEGIFVIPDLLTTAQCGSCIEFANQLGFMPALQQDQGRKNTETHIDIRKKDTPLFIKELFSSLCGTIATQFKVPIMHVKINPILEFYSYTEGQFISPHCDAPTEISPEVFSTLTLVLYLNDDFCGGETRFIKNDLSVSPAIGAGLFFKQEGFRHEGMAVTSGRKYILRTSLLLG